MKETILLVTAAAAVSVYAAMAQPLDNLKTQNQQLQYELQNAESERDRTAKELEKLEGEFEMYRHAIKDSRN